MSERFFVISPWDEFENVPELVAFLVDPVKRLGYVLHRLGLCRDVSNKRLPDKVLNAASRILCGDNSLSFWLGRRFSAWTHVRKYEPDLVARSKPLRMDQIGHVYFAKSPLRPSNLKIGFTTRLPSVRVKTLMANSGEELSLLGSFPATLMDEQILQHWNIPAKVAGEWYAGAPFLPDVSFLQDELREAA